MSGFDRRTFVQGLAGALALGSIGTVAGHPSGGSHTIHEHEVTKNTELVGFHSLGGKGSESLSGRPEDAMYGALSEVWVEDDLAFVSMLSSSEPTGNRGVAVLDVSGYTRAGTPGEADTAEMSVLSFIGNESEAGTAADVKVSDDGRYLFYSKQAFGWDYGEPASASTDEQDAPGPDVVGLEAYDISDPGNPEFIANAHGPNGGFHNCFTHRIGGDHYVFGVQGFVPGDAGVHVYRLDEELGALEHVNFWSGANLSQGEYSDDAASYYCHDFYAHDDPKTGKPLGFIAYWNNGVRVIDLSDPENIEELGFGEMNVAHYAQPAPALLGEGEKRVFVGGQEIGTQGSGRSGYVKAFDGDDLFEDGLTKCPVLGEWTLYDDVSFEGYSFSPHNADVTEDGWITQSHYHAGVRFLKIQPPEESGTGEWRIAGKRVDRFATDERERLDEVDGQSFDGAAEPDVLGNADNYQYHEFMPSEGPAELEDDAVVRGEMTWTPPGAELDLALQVNTTGDPENPAWLTIGEHSSGSGTTGLLHQPKVVEGVVRPDTLYRWRVETDYGVPGNYEISSTYTKLGPPPEEFDGGVQEEGLAYYRDHVEVPEETKTLSRTMSPNFWGARIENGVTFASGINTGLYAIAADPIDIGTRDVVDIDVTRRDDGVAFTGGQTNHLIYEVDTDTEVYIRDRLPENWTIVGGDAHEPRDVGDGKRVVFANPVGPTDDGVATRELFVDVGDAGGDQVGPVRYSADDDPSAGGKDWEPVPGTVETELVGPSQ